MMWNWLSGLITGGTIVLYDGSPGVPSLRVLWDMAAASGHAFWDVTQASPHARRGHHP